MVVVIGKPPDSTKTRVMELFDIRLESDDQPFTAARLNETVKTAAHRSQR